MKKTLLTGILVMALSLTALPATLMSGNALVPPDEVSPEENIALNPGKIGYPHPLESDRGWGGGQDKWDIIDGVRKESAWDNGLAFTGGKSSYIESCGWRQATINFGEPKMFNKVLMWHHGLEHVPNTYKIQYWDGTGWVDIFSTTNGHDYLKYPADPPKNWWESFSTPTENTFAPVTSTKVRFALNNCDIVHGWIYEFEVYESDMPALTVTITSPEDGSSFITDRETRYTVTSTAIATYGSEDVLDEVDWVITAGNDYSADQFRPASAENTSAFTTTVWVPRHPKKGAERPGALSYVITASVEYEGHTAKHSVTITQDATDRIRQMYIDHNIRTPAKDEFKGGTGIPLKQEVIKAIASIENDYGAWCKSTESLVLYSTYRNPEHNERVDGKRRSMHQYGWAIDISPIYDHGPDGGGNGKRDDAKKIQELAYKYGATWAHAYSDGNLWNRLHAQWSRY